MIISFIFFVIISFVSVIFVFFFIQAYLLACCQCRYIITMIKYINAILVPSFVIALSVSFGPTSIEEVFSWISCESAFLLSPSCNNLVASVCPIDFLFSGEHSPSGCGCISTSTSVSPSCLEKNVLYSTVHHYMCMHL